MPDAETWRITFEVTAEPDDEVSVGEMAAFACEVMMRGLIKDMDLWPTRWSVERQS